LKMLGNSSRVLQFKIRLAPRPPRPQVARRNASSSLRPTEAYEKPFILQKAGANSGSVATVFGCSGFLGRYVVETLAEAGMYVVTPFRGEPRDVDHLKVLGEVGQIAPVRYDVREKETINKAIEHSEVVVNMVGRAWETRNFNYQQVHVDAARLLAQTAKERGVKRFIHFSSVGADVNSPSPFLRSKAEGEEAVRQEFPQATILRLGPVFGPEDNLLNKWGWLTRSSSIRVFVNLDHKFQPLHFLNVSDAALAVLKDGGTIGKTYELGGPKVFSIESLLRELILPYMETQPTLITYPYAKAKRYVYWLEQLKSPAFLLSEVENSQVDLVTSEGSLGLKALKVNPLGIKEQSDVILKVFKPVKRMNY